MLIVMRSSEAKMLLTAVIISLFVLGVTGCTGNSNSSLVGNQHSVKAEGSPIPLPTPTAQITADPDGSYKPNTTFWQLFDGDTVVLTTFVSGPVTAQVNYLDGRNSSVVYETINWQDDPYQISIPIQDPSKIKNVMLYSIQTRDQLSSYCVAPRQENDD